MGFIHEHIILPISDLVKGERVHSYMRFLHQTETWDETQIKNYQDEKVRDLVEYLAMEVPYYQEWFFKNRVNPQEIQSVADLHRLPIVNKALMRSEGIERFTACGFPEKNRMASRSSGSTGEPFSFYVSKEAYSVNMAAKLRTWYQAGYRLGDRYMKIANGARHGRLKNMQDRMNRCIYVPFYSINDDTLKGVLDQIEKQKPSIIRSYPIPLYLLAQYRNSHSGYRFNPRHVMTTGSTLPLEYRKEIEKAFGSDVIDSYSCEGTPNTYETPAHDGYHVTQVYGIIEVLDEQDQPVTNGVGRVVSTDFWNLAHPFVRYDTQDLVEVNEGKIMRIMGRQSDALIHANGELFTVHNFSRFFLHEINAVDAYQVVRHKDGSITFNLQINDKYSSKVERNIIDYWNQLLNVPVKVMIVDEIPLMRNNKRLTIIEEA